MGESVFYKVESIIFVGVDINPISTMAAFSPTFSATEAEDGKTVTFTLTAFVGANDENYVKSDFSDISLVLTDAYGDDITTLSFNTSDVVVYSKTSDKWINATIFLTGIGDVADYERLQQYPFKQITQTKLAKILQAHKCCGRHSENYCLGLSYLFGANNDKYISGNDVSYQVNINNTNAYFDTLI